MYTSCASNNCIHECSSVKISLEQLTVSYNVRSSNLGGCQLSPVWLIWCYEGTPYYSMGDEGSDSW